MVNNGLGFPVASIGKILKFGGRNTVILKGKNYQLTVSTPSYDSLWVLFCTFSYLFLTKYKKEMIVFLLYEHKVKGNFITLKDLIYITTV